MTKEEFAVLVKEYSNDTGSSSFHQEDHPAYVKMLAEGKKVLPMALERLKDSIGHDEGDTFDHDNDPHMLIHLIAQLTNKECWEKFPKQHAGKLNMLRKFLLKWGKSEGYMK